MSSQASPSANSGGTTTNSRPPTQSPPLDRKAIFCMVLLALQFGVQPILTRRYTPQGITRSTVILMQEFIKFFLALFMLHLSGNLSAALKGWTVHSWLAVAGIPAALYSVQNIAALTAYQNLDALTFNVLNQTKTLSAALCCYLVMGRPQSRVQVLSLLMLLLAALVMEGIVHVEWLLSPVQSLLKSSSTDDNNDTATGSSSWSVEWEPRHVTHGLIPIIIASFISGLAGALTQKNLQAAHGRDPYLFSMELCAAGCLILLASLSVSPDGAQIAKYGFWNDWTAQTFIPIVVNALGGIVVGLVTKYAGSVRKGFALIFGMLLSGVIQEVLQPDVGVTKGQVAGGLLAALSLYLHATHPPVKKEIKQD